MVGRLLRSWGIIKLSIACSCWLSWCWSCSSGWWNSSWSIWLLLLFQGDLLLQLKGILLLGIRGLCLSTFFLVLIAMEEVTWSINRCFLIIILFWCSLIIAGGLRHWIELLRWQLSLKLILWLLETTRGHRWPSIIWTWSSNDLVEGLICQLLPSLSEICFILDTFALFHEAGCAIWLWHLIIINQPRWWSLWSWRLLFVLQIQVVSILSLLSQFFFLGSHLRISVAYVLVTSCDELRSSPSTMARCTCSCSWTRSLVVLLHALLSLRPCHWLAQDIVWSWLHLWCILTSVGRACSY